MRAVAAPLVSPRSDRLCSRGERMLRHGPDRAGVRDLLCGAGEPLGGRTGGPPSRGTRNCRLLAVTSASCKHHPAESGRLAWHDEAPPFACGAVTVPRDRPVTVPRHLSALARDRSWCNFDSRSKSGVGSLRIGLHRIPMRGAEMPRQLPGTVARERRIDPGNNENRPETPWFLAFCRARPERFELPTFGSVDRRSIQLSYGRLTADSSPGSAAPRLGGGPHRLG
jgi:hypothetical protein